MDEYAIDGIPASGLPPTDEVERERERWDEGKTRQGTALRDGADAARRANRLCNRIRSPAPPLVRRNRDRRTGRGRPPARYRRNDAYFEWKRANRLRGKCSAAELTERLDALIERDRTYQERYAIPDPGDVSVLNHADLSDHEKVEAAHTEVNDWLSVRAEIRVTEQARRLWRDRPALA